MKYMFKWKFVTMVAFLLIFLVGCQNGAGLSNQVASNAGADAPSSAVSQPSATTQTPATPEPPAESSTDNHQPVTSTPTASENQMTSMGQITAVRLADHKSGWVGGEGWIARTDDGGAKWNVQYSGSGTVNQLFALNPKEAWATLVGTSGQGDSLALLRTTDGGNHWSLNGKVPNKAFLHFVSPQEAFSGNAHTTDGGKTWMMLNVPKNMAGDAYFHDKNNAWAVTQANGSVQVERTVDGGKTWKTVMSRKTVAPVNGTLIRSAGVNDAWIELIGDSGMTQTSYSLFHTMDGGKNWQTVIAQSTAGGGPAPGFPADYLGGPKIEGNSPGPIYVVDPKVAFIGGQCRACDKPNTIAWTKDGGKTLTQGNISLTGFGPALLAFTDPEFGWWITTDSTYPSELYTTTDGGKTWKKTHTFDKPKSNS